MSFINKLLSTKQLQLWCRDLEITLVDVGASGGIQNRWHVIESYLRVVAVEPDQDAFNRLVKDQKPTDRNVYLNTGLYDHAATMSVYLARQQVCSSIYPPDIDMLKDFDNWQRFSVERMASMKVERLDLALEKNGITDIDFLKVDTQGSELNILRGAGNYLTGGNIGVEVEVEFLSLYKGQPVFADVDAYMRDQGYELFDLARHFWRRTKVAGETGCYRGQLVFADALYFVSASKMESILAQQQNEDERSKKFIRAIIVILIYGYYDYALLLCDRVAGVSVEVVGAINRVIRDHLDGQFVFPEMRGLTRLALLLEKISEIIWQGRPNYDDRELGS